MKFFLKLYVCTIGLLGYFFATGIAQSLSIYHLDVGQGDATLIVAKDQYGTVSKTVLIDGGTAGHSENILHYAIDTLKLTGLNYVIATHYDGDHVGGLVDILNYGRKYLSKLPVDSVFDRGDSLYSGNKQSEKKYKDEAKQYGNKRKTLVPGQTITLFDDKTGGTTKGWYTIKMLCVCVNGFIDKIPMLDLLKGKKANENDVSAGFLISYATFHYLTCGDIGGKSGMGCSSFIDLETDVISRFGPVSAYKVNHHGSACSSNDNWVTNAESLAAIISCGGTNRYKHPRDVVIEALEVDTNIQKYFLTASVNPTGSKMLDTSKKCVLNSNAGAVILTVNQKNKGYLIKDKSVFDISGYIFYIH